MMINPQVRQAEISLVRVKAVEDARQMQASIVQAAKRVGNEPPNYILMELIGKGSYGRVYKGKDMITANTVAVKIINIDQSDTANPRNADTYGEFLKEIRALKVLTERKARNINHIIEALPVGHTMWMITEYCGGGSVATLMKPTSPGGLQEKWIIPILREVAEAIRWVHDAGIIHRDIKCANVLITEQGGVQLCDFGVAGTLESKLDKRSTFIGTLHWMAPELFNSAPSYSKEVDIWAFGSMVYEIATGLPPNVHIGASYERVGSYLKTHMPRLEGGTFSNSLRSLVACCLEEFPALRPSIEEVQRHPYIWNSNSTHPTSSLSYLVRAFRLWEDHGGSRRSLFMLGGAQDLWEGPQTPTADDEWNFSTTAGFDKEVSEQSSAQDVFDAYGAAVELEDSCSEEIARIKSPQRSRRQPPEALIPVSAPLERLFDPNTMSNYEDSSYNYYGLSKHQPISDLPLRDNSAQASLRDTMIGLGVYDSDTGLASFPETETIKAVRRDNQELIEDEAYATLHDIDRPSLSNPVDINANRRTQDWKFPTTATPTSAGREVSPIYTKKESGNLPLLSHSQIGPIGPVSDNSHLGSSQNAISARESLIDLDMSMPDSADVVGPDGRSMAIPHIESSTSNPMTSNNPLGLERHASLCEAHPPRTTEHIELQVYNSKELAVPIPLLNNSSPIRNMSEHSNFSISNAESSGYVLDKMAEVTRYNSQSGPRTNISQTILPKHVPSSQPVTKPDIFQPFPKLPLPPSEKAMTGLASYDEIMDDFNRMLVAMTSQLEAFRNVYSSSQNMQKKGSSNSVSN